jgi:type III restriction enzyme
VLAELREALEHNGFTPAEAERIIIPVPQGVMPLGVQPQTMQFEPGREIDLDIAQAQVFALGGKVQLNAGTGALTVLVPLDKDETEALTGCMRTLEAKAKVVEIIELVRDAELAFGGSGQTRIPSPYERRLDFIVPLLCVNEDGNLVEFEETFLIEHPWKLSEKNATLAENYNPLKRPVGQMGLVDVAANGRVLTALADREQDQDFIVTLHQQVMALGDAADWTLEYLVGWIDRHIDHQDIPLGESAEFLREVVRGLMAQFAITDVSLLDWIVSACATLSKSASNSIGPASVKPSFKVFLLPDSALTVSDTYALNFKDIVNRLVLSRLHRQIN